MNEGFRIVALSGEHDRSEFASGSEPLDRYLREQVSQDIKRRVAVCFVAVGAVTGRVGGFYTLTATGIALNTLTVEVAKKLPRYPVVPAALMGRLAVSGAFRGQGLGGALLSDAVLRVARAEMGVFALLVDAKDDASQRFYEHFGFTLLSGTDRRLCLPIALALRQLDGKQERPV